MTKNQEVKSLAVLQFEFSLVSGQKPFTFSQNRRLLIAHPKKANETSIISVFHEIYLYYEILKYIPITT